MTIQPLFEQIADSIRKQILNGLLMTGDHLPPVRTMTKQWRCTTGTVQRAYKLLASEGLVTGHARQGTRVIAQSGMLNTPLRRAALIHKAEAFLLEVLTEGYAAEDVEESVRQALDRWRAVKSQTNTSGGRSLQFQGSHDLAVTWLASHFDEIAPGYTLQTSFSGSLSGLMALAEGKADLAGCHLWDEESNTYNLPYVRRVLAGQKTALIHLATRRIGLIIPPGNPFKIRNLSDLVREDVQFINRQVGSGTRVWLDANLNRLGIDTSRINGYANATITHSELARAIAEGKANCGLGLEAVARFYNLDFIFLAEEYYDLVCLRSNLNHPAIEFLLSWLQSPTSKRRIANLAGYRTKNCGQVVEV